jgi:hypothetical protein
LERREKNGASSTPTIAATIHSSGANGRRPFSPDQPGMKGCLISAKSESISVIASFLAKHPPRAWSLNVAATRHNPASFVVVSNSLYIAATV